MRSIYEYLETEAILLLDASNAFDSLNRQVASRNISLLFLSIHPILVNTYRKPSDLIVGGTLLLSQEGTTQGDPLAMAMYALATIPLITKITANGCKQICYADDAASGRKLFLIRKWWQQIIDIGPKYGYHPNQ